MTAVRTPVAAALAASLLGIATQPAAAPPRAALLQPASSEIAFTTRQTGVGVEGHFMRFDGQIALDPKAPDGGSVALTIDTGSARFGSAELDAEVPKTTWLDAAKFPQATFRSTAIRSTGPDRYDVAGRLSIKGTTRDIVVPVQLAPGAGGTSTASGAFTVKRLEFRVGEGEWADVSMVANDVQVRFKLVLTGL